MCAQMHTHPSLQMKNTPSVTEVARAQLPEHGEITLKKNRPGRPDDKCPLSRTISDPRPDILHMHS